ncbi:MULTISPECIES: YfbU family protein [unclassified Curtobacterium]|uniref:YfbU family protein n=1 Tax=unclassified Curtobacterium TaxID=257496 RepID=UPI003A7FB945
MSEVITFRVPDDAYRTLEATAREHGLTVGPHAREIVLSSLERDDDRDEVDRSGQAPVPERLSTVERHMLAMLHRIHAQQLDAEPDADGDWERERAKVLEYGWTGEYPQLFTAIYAELPRRDSGLVMDILDMFRALETSMERLNDADRGSFDEQTAYRTRFRGFDANDDHESRLLSYARHLVVDQGRWPSLADRFEDDSPYDGGNSHHPWLPSYLRMLEVFTPIWREKIRTGAYGDGSFDLTKEELLKVLGAR